MLSRLLTGLALQVAKDDGNTILVGQAAQLLGEQGLEVVPHVLLLKSPFGHLHHLPFPLLPSGGYRPRLQRRLVGHAVEPVGHHLLRFNRRRLADEDEERGLESVFGVVVVAEDTAAHAPDHRTMPPHQGCKGGIVSLSQERLQQLPIGHPCPVSQQHGSTKVLDDLARVARCHRPPRWWAALSLYLTITRWQAN